MRLPIQSKSLRQILVRGFMSVALLAVGAMSHPLTTFAQELPPLRENKKNLNNIMSFLRADAEIRYIGPGLDLRTPFNSIVVAVTQPVGPAQRDLMDVSTDTQALTDYFAKVIETRLAELGVSDEIALHMTTTELQKPTAGCGELRMLLGFLADEVELDGRSVVAVTVRIDSWTGAFGPQPDQKTGCLGEKGPPWRGSDEKIFLVDRGDRETALAKTKQAILSMVDGWFLTRLVFSNDTARSTVGMWLKEGK